MARHRRPIILGVLTSAHHHHGRQPDASFPRHARLRRRALPALVSAAARQAGREPGRQVVPRRLFAVDAGAAGLGHTRLPRGAADFLLGIRNRRPAGAADRHAVRVNTRGRGPHHAQRDRGRRRPRARPSACRQGRHHHHAPPVPQRRRAVGTRASRRQRRCRVDHPVRRHGAALHRRHGRHRPQTRAETRSDVGDVRPEHLACSVRRGLGRAHASRTGQVWAGHDR